MIRDYCQHSYLAFCVPKGAPGNVLTFFPVMMALPKHLVYQLAWQLVIMIISHAHTQENRLTGPWRGDKVKLRRAYYFAEILGTTIEDRVSGNYHNKSM